MDDATPDWLIQHSRLRGETRAVAITGNSLQVASQSLFGRRRYAIHLSVLTARPVRRHHFAWRWLLAACAALGGAVLFWRSGIAEADPRLSDLVHVSALLAIVGGVTALGTFFYRSYSMDEYRTRYAGCTVCALHRRRPDARSYQRFVEELAVRIEDAQQKLGAKPQRWLAAELRELRRLAQEGALPEAAYRRAKASILACHGETETHAAVSEA